MESLYCSGCGEFYDAPLEIRYIATKGLCTECDHTDPSGRMDLQVPLRSRRCPICRDYYDAVLEIRQIACFGFCSPCARSNPFCQSELRSDRPVRRMDFKHRLAQRFRLPSASIKALLEDCTEEEMFDLLSEMEDAGTLAAERQRLTETTRSYRRSPGIGPATALVLARGA